MRYQAKSYSCGAAAVVNAARVFGKRIDERRVRTLAGTDLEGTSTDGVVDALRALSFSATLFEGTDRSHAWRWLHGALVQGSAVILSVDLWQHWVVCIGLVGERVILIDSTNTQANKRENGTHVLDKNRLLKRWRSNRTSTDNTFFAICTSKPKKVRS